MKRSLTLLTMAGVGAGLIYFLDPKRGPARRDQVKGKVSGAVNSAKAKLSRSSRQLHRDYIASGDRQF